MPATYNCPITDCTWTCRDEGPQKLDGEPSEDELHAQAAFHQATVEHALRTHYEEHDAEEWVTLVAKLTAELAGRQVLACVGCMGDRWQAEQQAQRGPAQALPPLLPPIVSAVTMVGGNALCRAHLAFGEPAAEPQLPGRTRSGLIMPGGN